MLKDLLSMLSNLIHMVLGIGTAGSYPPPLPAEQERRYFIQMKKGDRDARRELILHNLRLVAHIVRKYYPGAKNSEDLISIGTLGLIKAVDSFQVEKGAKFATYGARCIQNEILMHFRAQKKLAAEVSLNETIDVDRDGNPLTYIDVLGCDESMTGEIERKIASDRALRYINTMLSGRERSIVLLRYGIGRSRPLTQREVAERLKISRSYVSRLEKSAMEKLSAAFQGSEAGVGK